MSPTHSSAFDLITEAGVEAYLADTPFACEKATALTGGSGNWVFRLHLRQPFEGKTTLVLKHSRSYIKNWESLSFDIKRQIYEVEAFRRVREWSSPTSFITVPTVYLHDEKEHAVIMDDCGETSMTLKAYMQSGRCSTETAQRIGKGVGEFIGRLHAWGHGNTSVCSFFEQNQEAKDMSSWVFYGRLVATFDQGLEKLKNPDVQLSREERSALEKIADESGTALKQATGNFVMGDFWPGNLVVSFDDRGEVTQVRVLDWELCKAGIFGMELGQFCAELVLLTRFNADACGVTAQYLLEDFLEAYTNHIKPDVEMCRRAIVHLGTHLITLTPTIEWGPKDTTQAVVREGLKLVLDGYSAERDWLEKSIIGPLAKSVT